MAVTRLATPIIAFLIALAPIASRADDLARGLRQFHDGEFEQSIATLTRATKTLAPGGARSRAFLFLGLARAVLSQWNDAREAFAKALVDDPTIAPDTRRTRPGIVEAFDAVRETVKGRIEVTSDRAARVMIGTRVTAPAPFATEIPVGRYTVRVRSLDSTAEWRDDAVIVRAGETSRIEAKLATMDVRANRPVVPVRVAERPWYRRPRAWAWISAGAASAVLVSGAIVGALARSAEREISTRANAGTLDYDSWRSLSVSAENRALAANVLFGVGAAAGVAATVLFLVRDPSAAPRVSFAPGQVVLTAGF